MPIKDWQEDPEYGVWIYPTGQWEGYAVEQNYDGKWTYSFYDRVDPEGGHYWRSNEEFDTFEEAIDYVEREELGATASVADDDELMEPDPACYACGGTGEIQGFGRSGQRCPCTYPEYWEESGEGRPFKRGYMHGYRDAVEDGLDG